MALVESNTSPAFAAVLRDDCSLDALGLAYSEKQIAAFHRWVETLDPDFKASADHCLIMVA